MKLRRWRRAEREDELDEEIRTHLRMAIRDRMERGESAEDAAAAARREFGNVGLVKETTREVWRIRMFETLRHDLRYGARMLLKQPGFTMMAILTLALGIGANTAIFSIVNSVLLGPPLAAQPEQLFRILKIRGNFFSFPNYRDLAVGTQQSFSMMAAHNAGHLNLRQGDSIGKVFSEFVTGNFFPSLGIRAAHGRTFGVETDGVPGAHPVVVMSYGLWQRRFGSDAGLVGQTIALNGHQMTVIGIMPEGFRGAWPHGVAPELWTPMTMYPPLQPGMDDFSDRGRESVNMFGRLKPGVSPAQAQADLSLVARRLVETYPAADPDKNRNLEGARLYPIDRAPEVMMRVLSVFIGLVFVLAGLLLLLVCANVTNLLLARAVVRRPEMAIRLALGASRWRLIRQLLTESALLAIAGGAAGCLLAVWVLYLLRSTHLPISMPIELNAKMDIRVLVFTLTISVLSGVLFGLAPARHAAKLDLVPMLKDDRRGGGKRPARFSLRNLGVVSQVSVSLVLLITAGLFTRSLQKIHNFSPGFETEHVLTVSMDLMAGGYNEVRGKLFYRRLLDQFEQAPGVQSASLAEIIPLKEQIARGSQVAIEGYNSPGGDNPWFFFNTVGPRYFETMKIPVLAGREFNLQDSEGAPPVVIVNESMAHRFWPGQSAVGRRLRLTERDNVFGPLYEVVGVVKDSKYRSLSEEPRSYFYVSALQNYRQHVSLLVHTVGEASQLRSALRDRVQALDKSLLIEIATMRENMAINLIFPSVAAVVLGLVGLFGLSLASVGIYGVISYAVSQRTGEIGLRMALGAHSRDILRLMIGQGMKLTVIGVGLGAIIALGLSRLLSRLLIGVSAADPLTFIAVPLLLMIVAFIACWVPARRAIKIDPMVALRCE
ncbi:MAG: ABC transporter permease [Acidobacteria bacterium]|nr:ABC transporter permease [Acidobacteriota bacterium]